MLETKCVGDSFGHFGHQLVLYFDGNPSKNPDIKTPLVVIFSLGVVIRFSPLAAF